MIGILGTWFANSQTNYQNLGIGVSFGKGYAFDLSYGKRDTALEAGDHGWDLLFSAWTPNYRLPIPRDEYRDLTPDDFYGGSYIVGSKDVTLGLGFGARYVMRPAAVGMMVDLVVNNHFDFYYDPGDGSYSQLRDDKTMGGVTGTAAVYINDRISVNGFYGTRRGVNVGVAYNIINP